MKLTTRELQLLNSAAQGLTDREISSNLAISRDTVSSYWRRILLKYGASSRTECVARYSQESVSRLVVEHEEESERLNNEIIERTEAHEREEAQRKMLAAITNATLSYIRSGSNLHETFNQLLEDVLSLTNSEYGFLGEVLYENGVPYLQERAITNISWNDQTRELYDFHHKQGLIFRNMQSLFGKVITTGKLVIANDARNDPRSSGLPEGHPVLDAFLGVPVYDNGTLIGMIGLANRPGGYSEEIVNYLEPLTATCSTYITGSRIKKERQEMQKRIAESEDLVKDLINRIPSGLVYETPDQIIKFVNQPFLDIFHFSSAPTEIIGLPCEKRAQLANQYFVDPEAKQARVDELKARGENARGDVLALKDGRHLERDLLIIRSNGEVKGYLWCYRDLGKGPIIRTEQSNSPDLASIIWNGEDRRRKAS